MNFLYKNEYGNFKIAETKKGTNVERRKVEEMNQIR
jgi:hypothetical protein